MKKEFIILKKLCAIITAVCFTFTIVCDNLYASVNAEPIQAQKEYFSSYDSAALNTLFSSKYGKVVSFNNNLSDTVLINIQDLHCDYFVQKNIASLIEEISKKYKIDNVYVEGGIGDVNTSFLANINSEYKQNILDNLLKEGKLTGTEYYSAISEKTDLLKGAEDKDIYLKNIVRLDDIINSKEEISVYLSKINKEIDFLKSKYLKDKNKQFDELLKQSENKNISQEKFIIELFNYAKRNNISLKNYENLQIYLSLFNYSVNNKKVQKELAKLLGDVKQALSYDEYNKLINLTSRFTDIQVLGFFIKDFCKEKNIDLSKTYPNLNKFLSLKEKSSECNPIQLVKEERALIDVIRTYLSENQTELEITYLSDFEQFYKGYLSASLTSTQWEYVKLGLNKFKDLYEKYSIENDVAKLEKYSKELNSFYDVNSERNEIFVKNMNLNKKAAQKDADKNSSIFDVLSNAKRIVVLVAGGYHTDGINEILNKKGITNITITPNITNSTQDSRVQYEYLAQQQAMSVRQMIALGLISNATAKEQILMIARSLLPNSNLDGVNINILVQQLNQIFNQDITFTATDDGKLQITSENEILNRETISVSDILFNSNVKNASAAICVDQTGKPNIVLKVSDIISAIEFAAENGLNEVSIAWDDVIVGGKTGREFSTLEELKQWKEQLSKELRIYGPAIREKAREKNITLSFHAVTFERDNMYLPSPNIKGWDDLFKFQIEIAKQLGGSSIVVHAINDYDSIDSWVRMIQIAKDNGIVINFENDLQYLQPQSNIYNKSLVQGFIGEMDFVEFLNAIRERLTPEESKYMGVCIDTARVFNAISSSQTGSQQEKQEQINFDNLLKYIETVIKEGYQINIIHLSQFNKYITRKVIVDEQEHQIFYNKSNISNNGVISASNLRILLNMLRKHNPNIVILQETGTDITTKADAQKPEKTIYVDIDEDIATIVKEQNKTSLSSDRLVQVTGERLKNIVSLVSATTFNQGTGIFAPQIYQISKTVCLFMVENKWYLGNGAVWEIANSEQNGQTLDGVEPVVYEYMPDFMQKALQSKQIGKDLAKKSLRKSILSKVLALILTVALMFGLTGCKSNVDYPRTLTPASITEIIEYQDESEQVMEMFNSDRGYLAYLPSYMTEEEISEWSSKDFYYVDGLVNTYDQAHAAIVYLKMGETEKAREALLAVQNNNCKSYEIRRISGRKETLYRIYKSNRESGEILGEIVWVGLAAVQYKLATGSDEFDTLIKSVDEYILSRECVKGAGYYMGNSVMYFTNGGYSSAEHQVDIMAYFTLKSLLNDSEWRGVIPEHIVAKVLPKGTELIDATSEQLDEMVALAKKENSELLFNACKAFYKNMYKAQGVIRGYNDYYLVLDPNSWGLQVLLMIREYDPKVEIKENGTIVEKSIYEASELSKIDLNALLESIETNFFVTDEELQAGLSVEDYQRFKGYHLYTWSREKFVEGKLNWSFEWSMQVATAYYLMGNYQQAEIILNDARRFASEMGLPEGMLPASNVNAVLNYTDYGWRVPNAPSFAATITSVLLEYGLMKADPTYASPFFPIETESKLVPSSILPGTIKEINKLISQGVYSLKKFLAEILNNETIKSLFNPLGFIKSHTQTTGAKILIAVTSAVFFAAFGALLAQTIPFVLSLIYSLVAALAANVGTHAIIDYRYLKSIGLSEAVNLYGKENVRLTDKGLVIDNEETMVPVYVINDRPVNSKDFKFKSVPVKVRTLDGKLTKCWIGNYRGATIIFAEGAKYENIVKEFSTTKQFESMFGGSVLKANVDVIEIDMIDADSNLRYSQTGNPIIGVNKLKTMDSIDIEKEISLIRNKGIEAVTINQNIAIYIDDAPETVSTSQDFIDTINLYVNSADLGVNAKILFTDEYINKVFELLVIECGSAEAAQKEFVRIIEQLKKENKEISVILKQSDINKIDAYKSYGIFSYIVDKGSYGCEYIDTISDTKIKANFITNLNQVRADGNLAIIKVSDFKKEISKTSGLFTFLNSSLNLKEILQKRNIEFIKQTANNFDFNQIPNIDIEIIAKIIVSSENKFEQLSKYLNGSDSISMYYLGLSNDEQRSAFMDEILKRALVINYLRNFEQDNAYYGLQDKSLENILAKALVEKYKLQKTFEINSNAGLNETTAAEVEFELLKKISQLSQQAFEQNDPQALDDIIKLIPLYADRKVELRTANINVVDIQNIKGILSAA